MHIVDLSVKRPIMILMGILALVLFGALAYMTIPISLLPDIKIPYVTIQTVYPGASPEVIESQITKPIEDQISSVGQLDRITSYSIDSVSIVMAQFTLEKDENLALQEVKDKVEVILSDLPDDAEAPAITKVNISSVMPVVSIILEGDMLPTELYTFGSTTVRDRLSQIDGVGNVDLAGGREREIRVELDRNTVFSQLVSPLQITGVLGAAGIELPGGNLQYQNRDLPVRLDGEFSSLDDISNLDITTSTGTYKLRQLAEVKDSAADVRERTVFLDKSSNTYEENAVLLNVIKNPSANTVDVVNGVMKRIDEIEKEAGGRIQLKVISEDGTYVRDSVDDTLNNVYLGILFTGLILLFFLHDLRSTLIVVLAMPFSIISTFLIMNAMGISLNMLSLMGISSAIGTLVANSVVVLENIFRHKEHGHSRMESAVIGSKEVTVAVFASTLTNIAVFVPLGMVSGVMGQVLSNFAYTIVIATVFSFVVSFTLTPMMASRILPAQVKREGAVSRWLEHLFSRWEDAYVWILKGLLKNRLRGLGVVVTVLFLFTGTLTLGKFIEFEQFPQTDGGKVQIDVELPQGNDLSSTARTVKQIEDRLATREDVVTILENLGTMGQMDSDVSVAQMDILLTKKSARSKSNEQIAADVTRMLSDIPGATIRVTPVSELRVSGQSAPVSFNLQGPDLDILQRIAEELKNIVADVPGITNTSLSSKAGKTELVFHPIRKQIAEDGLTVQTIARNLRAAVDGMVAATYKEGGEEYDILVTIKDESIKDMEDLKNIPIVSNAGVYPISRYAELDFSSGSNKIMRNDKERTIEITANTLPGYAQGNVLNAATAAVEAYDFPRGYGISQGTNAEMFMETVRNLIVAFFVAVVLTYMLLAATLESLTQPLFILSTVPLSLMGVILICVGTGTVLNIVSMLGIIMLVGIVVNNAILILDYYNQQREQGIEVREALITACRLKLKPVLMSNIAIVLGMLPMALGLGASGAEMRQPMGVVIIGGILSAMVLTLILLPVLEFLLSHRERKPASEVTV